MKPACVLLCISSLVGITSLSRAQIVAVLSALPRLDRQGMPLPAGAVERLRDPRYNHLFANAIAVSPDGRLAALAHNDGVVYLWNLASATEARRFLGHHKAVTAVAYAPDGSALASAGDDGTVRIWDAATGKQRRCFTGHVGPVRAVAFAPDGSLVASGGSDSRVLVWEARTGKRIREFPLEDRVNSVAFSADGKMLTAGSSYVQGADPGRVWSVATSVELFRFGAAFRTVNAVAFSPDGKTLASASDYDSIELLEVATGRGIRTLRHNGYVKCVAFSPDGRTLASAATAGQDYGPRLWDLATGRVQRQFTGLADATLAVAFTPDNRTLLSAGRDSAALLWPLGRDRKPGTSLASLSAADLEDLWDELKENNPAPAHRALWQLVVRPDLAVPLLRGQLRPAKIVPLSPEWIAKLDSPSFQEREEAMARLERLSDALPELQKASARPGSVEAGRRLDLILRKLTARLAPEWLRTLRSIQVLELIGDRDARAVLEGLAGGAPTARLTHEARAALKRLNIRASAAGTPLSQ